MDNQQQAVTELIAEAIDPTELEKKMLEKEAEKLSIQPDGKISPAAIGAPEDLAAAFFKQNYPRVKRLLGRLSKRGIERAVICAAAYPMTPNGYKWQSEEERELAWALEQMIACKAMMIEATKLNKMETAEQSAETVDLSLQKGDANVGNETKTE